MKLFNMNRVLCLSPHPDDVEISMSATIFNHPKTEFHILCCSMGNRSDPTSSKDRQKEVIQFWRGLGVTNVTLYFYEGFNTDFNSDEFVKTMESFVNWNSKNYDGIFIPTSKDTHPEHVFINENGLAFTRNKLVNVFEYRCISTMNEWVPNIFISTGKLLDKKITLLRREFKTQSTKQYFSYAALEALHLNFNCIKRGQLSQESFKLISFYE